MIKRKKAILCAVASIALMNSTIAVPASANTIENIVEAKSPTTKMEVFNTSSSYRFNTCR